MALAADRAIAHRNDRIAITWIINESNLGLAAALDAAGATYTALDLNPAFRFGRNPISVLKKTLRTTRLLQKLKPGLIVLIQGWILDGFDGVFAARVAGLPFCSYIPMAHAPSELALHGLARVRDAVLSVFFRLISRYITIDEQQAARIRRWSRNAKVTVVENFISCLGSPAQRTPEAKQRFGLPANSTVLGVVGRINFRQKAQDWLVDVLREGPFLEDKALVFVGDGPDSPKLTRLIESSPWRARMYQLGWRDDVEDVYNALDILLIPSRVEGVPLVMLEALARRIPVVGTDRDGMKSWLPLEWQFPFGNAVEMMRAIERALNHSETDYWNSLEPRLMNATDERRYALEFGNALIDYGTLPP